MGARESGAVSAWCMPRAGHQRDHVLHV